MQVKSMYKYSISLLALAFALFLMSEARADCNFQTVTNVNFGSYDVLSDLNNDSTGSVGVICNLNTWVEVAIGPSPNSGGFNPRKMVNTSTGDLLSYNLFTTSARATIWGNGTQSTSTVTNHVLKKDEIWAPTIFGRIPAGQDVGIGNYGEVLVVTINF
jgi:spore coat protein U-like protein